MKKRPVHRKRRRPRPCRPVRPPAVPDDFELPELPAPPPAPPRLRPLSQFHWGNDSNVPLSERAILEGALIGWLAVLWLAHLAHAGLGAPAEISMINGARALAHDLFGVGIVPQVGDLPRTLAISAVLALLWWRLSARRPR